MWLSQEPQGSLSFPYSVRGWEAETEASRGPQAVRLFCSYTASQPAHVAFSAAGGRLLGAKRQPWVLRCHPCFDTAIPYSEGMVVSCVL